MSLAELLPEVRRLPREDKLTLYRQLSDELAVSQLLTAAEYPVWSPTEAFEAAEALLAVSAADRGPA